MGAPDYTKVNVQITPARRQRSAAEARETTRPSCTPTDGGWHYDNKHGPPRRSSCATRRAARSTPATDKPKVDVVLGCASIG